MFKRFTQMLAVSFMSSFITVAMMSGMYVPRTDYEALAAKFEEPPVIESIQGEVVEANLDEVIDIQVTPVSAPVAEESVVEEPVYSLTQEEIDLIALVTMAEAEGECEDGKRLVIDTILNRVDGKYWPDTVHEVIYQPHQFTSMWNGRADRCYVKDDIVELVKEELISRYNYDVALFRTGHYSEYGTPMFKVGAHYFSSYSR